ncbi:hypothetical protein DSECCO2_423870 [anaerobic digester metagenome]
MIVTTPEGIEPRLNLELALPFLVYRGLVIIPRFAVKLIGIPSGIWPCAVVSVPLLLRVKSAVMLQVVLWLRLLVELVIVSVSHGLYVIVPEKLHMSLMGLVEAVGLFLPHQLLVAFIALFSWFTIPKVVHPVILLNLMLAVEYWGLIPYIPPPARLFSIMSMFLLFLK